MAYQRAVFISKKYERNNTNNSFKKKELPISLGVAF